jgi:hypothetical protein
MPEVLMTGPQKQPVLIAGPQMQPVLMTGPQMQPVLMPGPQRQPVLMPGPQMQPRPDDGPPDAAWSMLLTIQSLNLLSGLLLILLLGLLLELESSMAYSLFSASTFLMHCNALLQYDLFLKTGQ